MAETAGWDKIEKADEFGEKISHGSDNGSEESLDAAMDEPMIEPMPDKIAEDSTNVPRFGERLGEDGQILADEAAMEPAIDSDADFDTAEGYDPGTGPDPK